MQLKKFFITGTDTGIGKTLIAAIVTKLLQAHYWKPISSREPHELSDTTTVQQLTGLPDSHFFPATYEFLYALSPNHAAEKSGMTIELNKCQLPEINNSLIVEGAGGVFVPVNDHESILDLIKTLHFPVIIVCRGTLGTINHTLLTIEALRRREIPIHGVVFSGDLNPMSQKTIEQWGNVRTLFHVPRLTEVNENTVQQWIEKQGRILYDNLTA